MEVDCQPEDLPMSYDERCVEPGVKDMRLEAEAIVSDVLFAVSNMFVSKTLTSSLDLAFINVETREGKRYCLELSEAGLRVSAEVLSDFLNALFLIPQSSMFHLSLHCRWWDTPLIRWMQAWALRIMRLFTHSWTLWAQVTEKLLETPCSNDLRGSNKNDSEKFSLNPGVASKHLF